MPTKMPKNQLIRGQRRVGTASSIYIYILVKIYFPFTHLKCFILIMHTKPQEYIIRTNNTHLYGLPGCDVTLIGRYS